MSGLDSIYAMVARPQRLKSERKRKVAQVNSDTQIQAEDHQGNHNTELFNMAAQQRSVQEKLAQNKSNQQAKDKLLTDDDAPLTNKTKPHKIDVEI
ncbi:hypothetical protein EXU30_11960 [Shewanella maritima]|uniref:Uncharacterized protein n=1 Tax=Shewanella maritima TaxID=2520507 RepID=A0A411PIA9_9GAMM|nr:hypothetical protein [Shewanella maritima]QBF83337.1 hypothetical protein EXU30_11960 [Shewanella maritima]